MKFLIIIFIIFILVIVGYKFSGLFKIDKENNVTIQDLMDQARFNVPGTSSSTEKKTESTSKPYQYNGTLLVVVPDNEQNIIRQGAGALSYPIYTPTKIPEGFKVRPDSVSSGMKWNISIFQTIFSNQKGDNLFIYEYNLSEYLTFAKMTLGEYIDGAEEQVINGRKIYVANTSTKNTGKFQYVQGISVIIDAVLIKVEYFGEKRLSNEDLTNLGASFIQ